MFCYQQQNIKQHVQGPTVLHISISFIIYCVTAHLGFISNFGTIINYWREDISMISKIFTWGLQNPNSVQQEANGGQPYFQCISLDLGRGCISVTR